MRTKKTKKQKLAKKADDTLQEHTRSIYKYCYLCGSSPIVGHHFIRKSNSTNLRFDMKNIVPLCAICHCAIHGSNEQLYAAKIATMKGKAWVKYLEKNKLNKDLRTNLAFYEEAIERLKP